MVGSRWMYNVKHAADGSVENYKARFMENGYSHMEGIEYEETFDPVTK